MINNDVVVDLLLVEDDPSDAKLTIRSLRKAGLPVEIHLVTDGDDALDFLFCRGPYADRDITRQPRLVLLDIKLRKLDGLEVLRQMRGDPRTTDIPVVLLTSSRQDSDVTTGYHLRVNSYVVKPVDFQEFSRTVESLALYWLQFNTPPIRHPVAEPPHLSGTAHPA
jgi:two-component system response regulator